MKGKEFRKCLIFVINFFLVLLLCSCLVSLNRSWWRQKVTRGCTKIRITGWWARLPLSELFSCGTSKRVWLRYVTRTNFSAIACHNMSPLHYAIFLDCVMVFCKGRLSRVDSKTTVKERSSVFYVKYWAEFWNRTLTYLELGSSVSNRCF